MYEEIEVLKPEDWPVGQREANLEEIYNAIIRFMDSPTYTSKEILFALVTQTDLNEMDSRGVFRCTKYEVALMNTIYMYATILCCDSIKIYLYRHIAITARNHKMIYYMNIEKDLLIEEYSGLHLALKVFYLAYTKFNYEKNQALCSCILDVLDDSVDEIAKLKGEAHDNALFSTAHAYILMLKDLSACKSNKLFGILSFDRKEIFKLIERESKLIDLSHQYAFERPLRSVVILTLRNWVLKSRNNYSDGYFYKCISTNNAKLALDNHEVWMKKIQLLNDPRETKVLSELATDNTWKKYEWAYDINISFPNNHFVCSYTKTLPDEDMKEEYGENVFGYKNDRISDVLTPIETYQDHLVLGDVMFYDVIYSREEAKEEINYLCDLIDLYSISKEEKNKILNEMLPYWYLSFKDDGWKKENERRYHVALNKNRKGLEGIIDGDFYKCKTSLYLYPDFIFGSEEIKEIVMRNRLERLEALATKPCLFCYNCLHSDFDYIENNPDGKCSNCGSTNTIVLKSNNNTD